MIEGVDRISRRLARCAEFALRRTTLVGSCVLVITLCAGWVTASQLGFNLDPNALFSEDLRFQRMIARFSQNFPVLTNSLLVVVDGDTPEAVREGAQTLTARLREDREHFTAVYEPGEEGFFDAHGLLYNDLDDLDDFSDSMAQLQPVIGALSREASLASLSRVVRQGIEHLDEDPAAEDSERWRSILEHFRRATVAVYAEGPVGISWEAVLLKGTPLDPTLRRVIVVDPVLEFGRVLAAERPIERIRQAAEGLRLRFDERVRVRVTGYPALNHEEFLGLAGDTALAGGLSLVLVLGALFLAFRSRAVMGAAAITLIVGFVWTAAYASIVVGRLNVVSIAFAVLFIGLGVDFLIHLGMTIVAELRTGASIEHAVRRAVETMGSALLLCAGTTSIGFLAFLPTDYRAVSELGLIATGGMMVIFLLSLTLFPMLLATMLRGRALEALRASRPVRLRFPAPRRPGLVVALALGLALLGVAALPHLELETNVLAIRDPNTESVRAFEDLLDSDLTTPWYLDMLAPDLAQADALAAQVASLPTVERAISLTDYVPDDQHEKLAILEDVALMLDLPESARAPLAPDFDAQLRALRNLVDALAPERLAGVGGGIAVSGERLRAQLQDFLGALERDEQREASLARLDAQLVAPLAEQFERLQRNVETRGVTLETLPATLVERMLARDGTARVQVFPREDLTDRRAMIRFVESVRPIWGDITGLPVNLVESSYATWESLGQALLWAFLAIFLLLLVLWRRPFDALLVMLPLGSAVLLTSAASAWLGWPLTFVNICVLPLLLGIGIDSGVHMVHRVRHGIPEGGALLESTTAQAVFFSALTTLASFGTLVLSDHRGIASLGELLVLGMTFTMLGNLVLLPALLELAGRGSAAPAARG